MILGISNLYYAPKFIKYFSYFTFEEMKILISLLYPCLYNAIIQIKRNEFNIYI